MRTILATVVAMALAVGVSAECPGLLPPCEALARSSIVFVGDVTSAGPIEERTEPNTFRFVPHQSVRFRLVERFKGLLKDQKRVDASVSISSAEAISFVADRRYVVFVRVQSDGKWSTTCSRTGTLEQRPDDVRELRACTRR
jgi:hypothetical protein